MRKTFLTFAFVGAVLLPLFTVTQPSIAVAQSTSTQCPSGWDFVQGGLSTGGRSYCQNASNTSTFFYLPLNGSAGYQCPNNGTLGLSGSGSYVCYDSTGNSTAATAPASSAPASNAAGASCTSTAAFWANFRICLGRSIAVFVGETSIYLSSWFLGTAGTLFNYAMSATVVGFNETIYGNVASGVQAAWTAFRDISNILIIGIFVFIALEMILGTSTFGGKKTIAKVLIIAVLINFSMLFSRIVIESANFVSKQFYDAVQLPASSTTGGSLTNQYSSGIAGRFASMMGVTGTVQTNEALWAAAEKHKNGWTALLMGLLTAVVFVAAGALFLYAAFLMIARAILLVFLIMTSSLAFASYLLPKSFTGGYGWSAWWGSLLRNAAFGPLLIIMLWATLKVGEGFSQLPGNGQIGGLLNNPSDSGSIAALFSYLIILGMLYASIKIASSFAKKIEGFSYAATIPAFGLGAASRVIGFAGRNSVGRVLSGAANVAQTASQSNIKGMNNLMARRSFDTVAQTLRKGAKADFNPLKASIGGTSLAAEMQKVTAFKKPESFVGKDIGGYEGALKKRAEAIEKQAERMTPKLSEDQKKTALKKAHEEVEKEGAGQSRAGAERQLNEVNARLKEAQQLQKDATNAFSAQMSELTKELGKAQASAVSAGKDPKSDERVRELNASIERERSRNKSEMQSQLERIKRAQDAVESAKAAKDGADRNFAKAVAAKLPSAEKTAGQLVSGDLLSRVTLSREDLLKAVRKQMGDSKENKEFKKLADMIKKQGGGAAPQAPATAPEEH